MDALQQALELSRTQLHAGQLNQVRRTSQLMLSEAHRLLGQVEMKRGDIEQAARHFDQAIQWDGSHPEWHFDFAVCSQRLGRVADAVNAYSRAIQVKPDYPAAHHNLATIYRDQGNLEQAAESFLRATQLDPESGLSHRSLGIVLRRLWRFDDSLRHLQRARELMPDDPTAARCLAEVYEKLGRFDDVWRCLQPFIEAGTHDPQLLRIYANLSKRTGQEEHAISLIAAAFATASLSPADRCSLHFARGALLDKLKRYDEAFQEYRQGNALDARPFDPEEHRRFVDALIDVSGDGNSRTPRASENSEKMIFIVGMPRSGTTLVEQILASHPHVHGAGELLWVRRMADSVAGRLDVDLPYPACMASLTQDVVDGFARSYLDGVDARSHGALRVTDKMTFNFLHLGLIASVFPQARIVHCTRNSLDCCLSCYFTELGPYNPYGSDLEHTGRYFRDYQRLMAHYHRVLDLPILTVEYEQVATNVEEVTRGLIDFCGLDFDERCLRFYETDRAVITGSYDQVRRPVYQSSIGRWRNYEQHLQPLMATLDEGRESKAEIGSWSEDAGTR